ncbi:hypothetical protein SCP_1203400 [Sparassis crispa]|uniref:Uncharacterized protein n=1 Tax=Sparassis crispa TaxID=139825 RepID=A0A401H154_9APHY|nr:hypothetical protein SCP_1203400 [Sparassis crispa]GBE88110.1 hypothetical protein SCP_1203400 [Sparassis crispa]
MKLGTVVHSHGYNGLQILWRITTDEIEVIFLKSHFLLAGIYHVRYVSAREPMASPYCEFAHRWAQPQPSVTVVRYR